MSDSALVLGYRHTAVSIAHRPSSTSRPEICRLRMSTTRPRKTWLITGCSSGFGNLFIPAVVARGDNVVATARNITSLRQHQDNDQVRIMQLDVTVSQDILDQKVAEAESLFGPIDVLVNNAGYVASGVWEEVTYVHPASRVSRFQTSYPNQYCAVTNKRWINLPPISLGP